MTQTMSAPTTLAQEQAMPQYVISDDDKERQKGIELAWQAYNGLLDKPLEKMPGEADDNVLSNRCQQIVDRGVDFLFGKELEISVEENAPTAAQELLDKVWGRKETRIPLLQKLAMNGAIAKRGFLRIVPNNKGKYRLIALDSSTVFVQTAPQDCETVLLYCIEYSTPEKIDGRMQNVYYREEIARIDLDGNASKMMPDDDDTWSIQHWTKVGERGAWHAAGSPITWAYEFPPVFSCQNLPKPNDFWGMPDITPDLIGVNASLNLVQSCINRILKLYGGPILWASGMGEGTIDVQTGKIIRLPLTDSKIEAVALKSDIVNALKFAADLRSDIDEQSGVPGVATGRISTMPRGQLSGVALELLFMPLMVKSTKKQMSYGELIIDVSKALLVLNGMSEDIDITLEWASPLPKDDLAAIQAAILLREAEVSFTTIQRKIGIDPEEEIALNQAEDERKLEAYAKGQGLPMGMPGAPALPGQQYPQPGQAQSQAQSPFIGGHA